MPALPAAERANLLVILIDDLRFDEFSAGGHPYMQTPHVDRRPASKESIADVHDRAARRTIHRAPAGLGPSGGVSAPAQA